MDDTDDTHDAVDVAVAVDDNDLSPGQEQAPFLPNFCVAKDRTVGEQIQWLYPKEIKL